MKISTEIASAARIVGEQRAIELIAKAGFDAWDFSMFSMPRYSRTAGKMIFTDHPLCTDNYAAFAKELRKIGEDCGIVCNQSHAPFPSLPVIYDYLKRAIECTAIAGGEICIIHPDNNKSAEENAEMYFELLPFAKEHGVKIATENMWNWNNEKDEASAAACSHHDDFVKHLEIVNDDSLVACLDIGHAAMRGLDTSVRQMILALGDKLQALHIHDNDSWHDDHAIPCSMSIDFNDMVDALCEINYKGYFTLEADSFLRKYDEANVFDGVKELARVVRGLADRFEQGK